MNAQLELGEKPAEVPCSWCGAPCTTTHQASPCCATCAKGTAKGRVTSWLQRTGRKLNR